MRLTNFNSISKWKSATSFGFGLPVRTGFHPPIMFFFFTYIKITSNVCGLFVIGAYRFGRQTDGQEFRIVVYGASAKAVKCIYRLLFNDLIYRSGKNTTNERGHIFE